MPADSELTQGPRVFSLWILCCLLEQAFVGEPGLDIGTSITENSILATHTQNQQSFEI